MKLLAPSYYPNFSCIASACKHSCCIGWEVCMNEASYQHFSDLDGGSGKIVSKIEPAYGEYRFKTDKNGRCLFLNKDGLCNLIIEYGEDVLCPICADHPRFRSFFEDFTEIGLGLSCEEAARIILTDKSPFALIPLSDDGVDISLTANEEEMLSVRGEMIEILEDDLIPISERIRALFELAESNMDALDYAEITDFLLSLERLDENWNILLNDLKDTYPKELPADIQLPLKKACVYFVYRHMPRALSDEDLWGAMLLSVFLSYLTWQLFARAYASDASLSLDSMVSIVRLLSGELEYSDENLDLITAMLSDLFS